MGGGGGGTSRDELAAILDARAKGKLGREKNESSFPVARASNMAATQAIYLLNNIISRKFC